MFKKRRIYLDYASAPPVCDEALRAMREAEKFIGNPGAIHSEGVAAKHSLESSRARIAALLSVKAGEIIFTSGLTEANNIAILGAARKIESGSDKGQTFIGTHWVVSSIEHSSILDCFAEVERMGGVVTHVNPDERGIITPEAVQKALRRETVFVSVGWGNNEIGTIQPLAKIARTIRVHEAAHSSNILFHSDVGQTPLYLSSTAHSLGVDLLSLGGNKLYGPHGVGALFCATGTPLARVLQGGPQEKGLRPGTENVALAAGFAAAFEFVAKEREKESKRLHELRENFASEILAYIPGAVINGSTKLTTGSDLKHALPHMLNVSIPNIQSEYLALALDHAGIALSTKSACREGEGSRSHVVEALGGEKWRAQNTLRFSLGKATTQRDIARVVAEIRRLVTQK